MRENGKEMKDKCLVCKSSDLEVIPFESNSSVTSDNRYIETDISHSFCNNCGYIFVNFDKRVDYEKFYKDDYDFLLKEIDEEPSLNDIKYSDILVGFYEEFITNDKTTFLDIGAGKGNFLNAIRKRFDNLVLTGLEPSRSFEQLNKLNFIKYKINDFFKSKDFRDTFSYLSMIGVLEHVPNPSEFLIEVSKVMNEDSYLLIEVPNFLNNKADLLTIDHLSKFTEESITNLFSLTGFEIVKRNVRPTVPMQYIIKKSKNYTPINTFDIQGIVNNAMVYLNKAVSDSKHLENKHLVAYGQGLILTYLLGNNTLSFNNLDCVIDDNPLYSNKVYKNKVNIYNLDDYKNKNLSKDIFLAMNDCYHDKVIEKLNGYNIFGASN